MNYVLLVFAFSFHILGFAYLKYESFFYLFGTFLLRKLGTLRLLITAIGLVRLVPSIKEKRA